MNQHFLHLLDSLSMCDAHANKINNFSEIRIYRSFLSFDAVSSSDSRAAGTRDCKSTLQSSFPQFTHNDQANESNSRAVHSIIRWKTLKIAVRGKLAINGNRNTMVRTRISRLAHSVHYLTQPINKTSRTCMLFSPQLRNVASC
jgi:hypothetical protein